MLSEFFIICAKYLFVLPVLILGVYFLTRSWPAQKKMAFFAVPAGLLTLAIGKIGSSLYYNPRPFVVGHFTPLIQHVADNGFPSDHALLVSSLAAIGMYWNRRLGAALWALAVLVAFSRVYVGLHHPLDVVGSIAFALIAVALWHAAVERVWKA